MEISVVLPCGCVQTNFTNGSGHIINQAMPYLIDGHNLIPKVPGMSLKSIDDEIHLIQTLQDFCRHSGKNVEVYFDNAPVGVARVQKHGRVKAHFIRAGRTADDAIISRLRNLGRAAKNWHVVSSDRQVIAAARSLQAQVISSERFAQALLPADPEDHPDPGIDTDVLLDPAEVEAWLDLFERGIEPETPDRHADESDQKR
jgi:predicted RNA-binding protein with PIN domain